MILKNQEEPRRLTLPLQALHLHARVKTLNHYIGLDKNKVSRKNIREVAAPLGKRNAVITTESKEGPTPSAFTVHHYERTEYSKLAELQSYITDCDYLKGDTGDSLLLETKYTLDLLSTNNSEGFFAMIEEANIDTYSHLNNIKNAVHCMSRFNKAVQYAMVFVVSHPDTLLIVTAGRETGGLKTDGAFITASHTTSDVCCHAIGSGAENITGTLVNTYIPSLIAAQWDCSFPNCYLLIQQTKPTRVKRVGFVM